MVRASPLGVNGYGKWLILYLSKIGYLDSYMLNYQRVTLRIDPLVPHSWFYDGPSDPWEEGVQNLKRYPDQSCHVKFAAQLERNTWAHRFKYGFLTPCSTVFLLHSSSTYDWGPLQTKIDEESIFAIPFAHVYHNVSS